MKSRGFLGEGLVKKPTQWLTNSEKIADRLRGTCSNDTHDAPWHRHIALVNGRAKSAARYPPKLCRAVLRGLKEEMEQQGEISNLEAGRPSPHEPNIAAQTQEAHDELESYWDDVRGGWLPPAGVRKARTEEVEEYRKYEVIEIRPIEEYKMSGKRAVDTKWVGTDKGP